jgi:cell division protein FtsZ
LAEQGITSLMGRVDTIITIPNDRLLTVVERRTTLLDAFRVADDVLRQGVQGISDIITIPGQINVDFADVRAVMSDAGPALMGIGYGVGDQRCLQAAQSATNSPLLEQTIHGAKGLLVNITSGDDLTLSEATDAMQYIHALCDGEEANIFFGTVIDDTMDGSVRVTVLATGFNPYSAEGRKVSEATYTPAAVARVEASTVAVGPTVAAPQPVQVKPQDTIRGMVDDSPPAKRTAEARRDANSDLSGVFDDIDLDIPAFIREHKSRQS